MGFWWVARGERSEAQLDRRVPRFRRDDASSSPSAISSSALRAPSASFRPPFAVEADVRRRFTPALGPAGTADEVAETLSSSEGAGSAGRAPCGKSSSCAAWRCRCLSTPITRRRSIHLRKGQRLCKRSTWIAHERGRAGRLTLRPFRSILQRCSSRTGACRGSRRRMSRRGRRRPQWG